MLYISVLESKLIGPIQLVSDENYIIRLDFYNSDQTQVVKYLTKNFGTVEISNDINPVLQSAKCQLKEYFSGKRKKFDIPLKVYGTEFQKQCWESLVMIPYGETRSYREQAESVGREKAFRAVGQSNHRNPIAIILPCHRVIGVDGALCGFGGGLDIKTKLLELESINK